LKNNYTEILYYSKIIIALTLWPNSSTGELDYDNDDEIWLTYELARKSYDVKIIACARIVHVATKFFGNKPKAYSLLPHYIHLHK